MGLKFVNGGFVSVELQNMGFCLKNGERSKRYMFSKGPKGIIKGSFSSSSVVYL